MILLLKAVQHHGIKWRVNMVIYTVRLGRWKAVKENDIPVMDVSLRNTIRPILKPTKEVIKHYKKNNHAVFIHEFQHQLINSYREQKEPWLCILRNDKIALGSGCSKLENLYIQIAIEFIESIAINHGLVIQRGGELTQ